MSNYAERPFGGSKGPYPPAEAGFQGNKASGGVSQISASVSTASPYGGLQNNIGNPVVPFQEATTGIIDDEGFSDDDEMPDDNPWLLAYRKALPPLPSSLRHHKVAVTGSFSPKLDGALDNAIKSRGAVLVEKVDADTTVLLSPHPFARSTKAHMARKLGLPIMDESYFIKLPLARDSSSW